MVSNVNELNDSPSTGSLGAKRGSQAPSASKILYFGKNQMREETDKIKPVYFPTSLYYLKYTRLR